MLSEDKKPLNVFVHLAYAFDADVWEQKWLAGKMIGINDRRPYGYYRAESFGANITHSKGKRENPLGKLIRLGLRVVLGFDLKHAWDNRDAMRAADVIWTHTESQSLSVLFVMWLTPLKKRPKTIMQSVWLIDKWHTYSPLHRSFFRFLMKKADVATFLSPDNTAEASRLFPKTRCELVLFGINSDVQTAPKPRDTSRPVNLISVGNDVHRDWKTLIDAVAPMSGVGLKIVSQTIDKTLGKRAKNVEILTVSSNEALQALYAEADIAIVPLKQNLHASGITVIEEAALRGLPCVSSDVGGLRAYFSEDEVFYVAAENPAALREKISEVIAAPGPALEAAARSQAKMTPDGLSSTAYVHRHIILSNALLGR